MSQETITTAELQQWPALVEEGNHAYSLQQYADAELKFAAALRLIEKWARPECMSQFSEQEQHEINEKLSKSLNNMAALYHTQGKYAMAKDLYERCLDLKFKLHGEDHLEVAVILHNLGALHCAKRQYGLAEPLYKRSLEIREKALGTDHPHLVTLLNNYALLLKRVNRPEEANALESRAKAILALSSQESRT